MTDMTTLNCAVPRFLASVRNADEASLAIAGGADIIDCKEPACGALGALPLETIAEIVRGVAGVCPVSATIGDVPCTTDCVVPLAVAVSNTGVDYVKVGLFSGGEPRAVISELGARLGNSKGAGRARLIGLLLADQEPDYSLIDDMRRAEFAGVMLDTAAKDGSSLCDTMDLVALGRFIQRSKERGLLVGLAGSLRSVQVRHLVPLGADILGFRGALCAGLRRAAAMDLGAIRNIARTIAEACAALPHVPPRYGVAS